MELGKWLSEGADQLISNRGRGRMSYSGYQVKGHTFSYNNKGCDKSGRMYTILTAV